tara:strand:+ start:285 stop:488 length:204 start_codon:yes stop_codon:yes gene_type:complete
MAYKKVKSGEATFTTEQKFNSVKDAVDSINAITEEEITVTEIKIDNTKIKKEEVIEDVVGQQDRTTK